MEKCRCGNQLDSRGYCHICLQYDTSTEFMKKNKDNFERKCDICNIKFFSLKDYMNHLEGHPQCKYCGERFISKKELNEHYDSYHKCSLCNEYYPSVSGHVVRNHPYCEFCDKRFLNQNLFEEHMKEVHSKCIYCDTYFKNNSYLDDHLQETHKCHVCLELFINPRDHLQANHPFCRLCNRYFIDENSYRQHNELEHKHECPYCNDFFNLKEELDKHLTTVHICSSCNSYFDDLRQHFIDKHFYCKLCENVFFTGEDYAVHLIQHAPFNPIKYNKDGTIQCPFCERSFISVNGRNQHIESAHILNAFIEARNKSR